MMVLKKNKNIRTTHDIQVMLKCTSFLAFYQNIELEDPNNKYDSARKSCLCLQYRFYPQSHFICRHNDQASEFFIVLKGQVGIYLPRNPDILKQELEILPKLKKALNKPENGPVTVDDSLLSGLARLASFTPAEQDFLANVSAIRSDKLYFKSSFLRAKFGALWTHQSKVLKL